MLIVHLGEDLLNVLCKSIGRLSNDLKTLLKDTKRELVRWCGGEPKSESFVCLSWLGDFFNDGFEVLKPRCKQVTVLEHDPIASHDSLLDQLVGNSSHTLTKGLELELVHTKASGLDELLDITLWIGTRTQNEDDWSLGSGLGVDLVVVEGW